MERKITIEPNCSASIGSVKSLLELKIKDIDYLSNLSEDLKNFLGIDDEEIYENLKIPIYFYRKYKNALKSSGEDVHDYDNRVAQITSKFDKLPLLVS